jgi:endonuclease III
MKSATKHADELRSLTKKLTRDYKPPPRQKQEPIRALVRAALSFDVPDAKADDAMKVIDREFVDLNELRVATQLELQQLLGPRYPQIERRVALVTQALNAIFEKEHTLNFDRLVTISKKDVRTFLRELPDMHPFVEAFVMLYGFEGNAVPIDDVMLAYLKDQEAVEPETSLDEAQKFIEHYFKAEEFHDLFWVLREAALASAADEGKKKRKK